MRFDKIETIDDQPVRNRRTRWRALPAASRERP